MEPIADRSVTQRPDLYAAVYAALAIVLLQNCDQAAVLSKASENHELGSEPQSDLLDLSVDGHDDEMSGLYRPSSTPEREPAESSAQALVGAKKYYVSKNGNDSVGLSEATAFRTIQQAANLARAGDTVVVLPGVYKEWVKSKNHGQASAHIRFVSEPRWAAKITPTKDAAAFWTSSGNYTEIEGFTLDGSLGDLPSPGVRGIAVTGLSSRIMHNKIHLYRGCTAELFERGGVGIGIGPYSNNFDTEVFGNVIQHTRLKGCAIPPRWVKTSSGNSYYGEVAGYGIYLATPNAKVYNNIISNFRIGIHLWHAPTGATVSHNLLFNTGPTGVGIIFGCGDAPFIQCKDITISNNIFMYQKGSFAIREYGNNAKATNRILNNLIFGNTTNDGAPSKAIETDDSPIVSGNLVGVDPKLVNYRPDGSGDYRLMPGSPAIDAATKEGAVYRDFNQATRPIGKADIGPYEYGSTSIAASTPSAPLSFTVK